METIHEQPNSFVKLCKEEKKKRFQLFLFLFYCNESEAV